MVRSFQNYYFKGIILLSKWTNGDVILHIRPKYNDLAAQIRIEGLTAQARYPSADFKKFLHFGGCTWRPPGVSKRLLRVL